MAEKKSLVKNSIFNMIYKGFTALFPLITTSYISRVLLPAGVGRVGYANTIVAYFVLIASLGIPTYGVKAIAQSGETKEGRSRTFWELFFINLAATLMCIVAYYVFVDNFPHFADRKLLFQIMGLMLVLNIFNIDWFYQGMEEYSYIATRSIIVKILSFVAMLLFVKKAKDYVIYAFILCVATAGNNLLNAWNLRKYIGKPDVGLHPGRHLKPVLILLASTIATEIYTMLDTIMLEYYHGETCVGYYSNPVKIVRMTYTVVIALVAVFYPRISYHYKQKEYDRCNELLSRGFKIMLLLALPCTVGIGITAEYIVPFLFGEAFLPSIGTLRILSVLVLVFSVAHRADRNRAGAKNSSRNDCGGGNQCSSQLPADSVHAAERCRDCIRSVGDRRDHSAGVACKMQLSPCDRQELCHQSGRGAGSDDGGGMLAQTSVMGGACHAVRSDCGGGSGLFRLSAPFPERHRDGAAAQRA